MSHWYKDGKLVPPVTPGAFPSVTTILAVRDKPGLRDWRDRVGAEEADRYKEERQDLGTRVHAACEAIVKNEAVALAEDILPFVEGFEKWQEKYQPTKLQAEVFMQHPSGYAGTVDLLCEIDGEPWVVDYKTSKKVGLDHRLQLVAYQQAIMETTGIWPNRAVLQLTDQIKRGYRFHPFAPETDMTDWKVFQAHKHIFDWLQTTDEAIQREVSWKL